MFGPGVNKPTNTKIKSGKKSEIMTPQKKSKIPNLFIG
tara:strand:+ start:185 stop:298 length:114 start_codon:yes stop_codon:yes gene_type:complete